MPYGLVQSSVERYHDVCGQARTISTHLKAVQSAKGSPGKNAVKWFYRSSVTFNMAVSQWLSCTHDILLVYFLCCVPQFHVKLYVLSYSPQKFRYAILLHRKQSVKHSCIQLHMPSFTRPSPYQSTHRRHFSKGLIGGCTFYIFRISRSDIRDLF